MIDLILITSLVFVTLVSLFIVINLYRKVDFLEQTLDSNYAALDDVINKMKEIDTLGAFESDDEVGSTFKMLQDEINRLDNLVEEKNNA